MDCVDIYQSVAIETLESDQSHYMIFVFIGELTNWLNKMFPETWPWTNEKSVFLDGGRKNVWFLFHIKNIKM
jgi:hypothetical protein